MCVAIYGFKVRVCLSVVVAIYGFKGICVFIIVSKSVCPSMFFFCVCMCVCVNDG